MARLSSAHCHLNLDARADFSGMSAPVSYSLYYYAYQAMLVRSSGG